MLLHRLTCVFVFLFKLLFDVFATTVFDEFYHLFDDVLPRLLTSVDHVFVYVDNIFVCVDHRLFVYLFVYVFDPISTMQFLCIFMCFSMVATTVFLDPSDCSYTNIRKFPN